jgi:hypothetical protein
MGSECTNEGSNFSNYRWLIKHWIQKHQWWLLINFDPHTHPFQKVNWGVLKKNLYFFWMNGAGGGGQKYWLTGSKCLYDSISLDSKFWLIWLQCFISLNSCSLNGCDLGPSFCNLDHWLACNDVLKFLMNSHFYYDFHKEFPLCSQKKIPKYKCSHFLGYPYHKQMQRTLLYKKNSLVYGNSIVHDVYPLFFLESLEGLVSPTIPSQSATNFMCAYIANFVTFDAFCRFPNPVRWCSWVKAKSAVTKSTKWWPPPKVHKKVNVLPHQHSNPFSLPTESRMAFVSHME